MAQKKDVIEVLNAIKIYENLKDYKPFNEKSFLKAHLYLMEGLIENSGKYMRKDGRDTGGPWKVWEQSRRGGKA